MMGNNDVSVVAGAVIQLSLCYQTLTSARLLLRRSVFVTLRAV